MYKYETKRIHKAWKAIKKYKHDHPEWIEGTGAKNLKTVGDFRAYYKSMLNKGVSKSDLLIVSRLKSQLRFKTELRTAKAAVGKGTYFLRDKKGRIKGVFQKKSSLVGKSYKIFTTKDGNTYRKLVGSDVEGAKEITLKEFRSMSTRDIAELRKDEIKKFYHNLIDGGMKSKDAKKEIASFYFGS